MKKKLTERQLHVVRRMCEGWELGLEQGYRGSFWWLQKNGLGKGGDCENVHASTAESLLKLGLVRDTSKTMFARPRPFALTDSISEEVRASLRGDTT